MLLYIESTDTIIRTAGTRYFHPITGEVYGRTDYDDAAKLAEIGAVPLREELPESGYTATGWEIVDDPENAGSKLRRPTGTVNTRTVATALGDLDARIDARSQEILSAGFDYEGATFDILVDQERWKEMLLAATAGLMQYPITVYAQDKTPATIADLAGVKAFCAAFMTARETVLAHGRILKASGRALATVAEIDAIEDPR